MGYNPQGRKQSDTTERLHFHFQGPQIRLQDRQVIHMGLIYSHDPFKRKEFMLADGRGQ